MLSIISILSATTLTAIGVSISTYFMSSQSVDESAPFSYTLKMDNKNYIREFEEKLNKSTNHKLIDKAEFTAQIFQGAVEWFDKQTVITQRHFTFRGYQLAVQRDIKM